MDRQKTSITPAGALAEILPEREVALRWRKSIRTLQRWRANRSGPPWLQNGGSTFYIARDILTFEETARHGGPEQ